MLGRMVTAGHHWVRRERLEQAIGWTELGWASNASRLPFATVMGVVRKSTVAAECVAFNLVLRKQRADVVVGRVGSCGALGAKK